MVRILGGAARTIKVWFSVGGETVGTLADDNKIAKSMGLSYGKYKALIREGERRISAPPCEQSKESKRQYTDEQAFALWKAGKNDCEIGKALGVSRQAIQKWRDTMELPSNFKSDIDTENYRLIKTPNGMFVIYGEDI